MRAAYIYPKPEKYRLKYAVKNEQGKMLWQIKDPCDLKKEFTFINDWGTLCGRVRQYLFFDYNQYELIIKKQPVRILTRAESFGIREYRLNVRGWKIVGSPETWNFEILDRKGMPVCKVAAGSTKEKYGCRIECEKDENLLFGALVCMGIFAMNQSRIESLFKKQERFAWLR